MLWGELVACPPPERGLRQLLAWRRVDVAEQLLLRVRGGQACGWVAERVGVGAEGGPPASPNPSWLGRGGLGWGGPLLPLPTHR